MLALLGACGLLVASSMIVRSAGGSSSARFCLAYGVIGTRAVELDGQRFSMGLASEEAELHHGCYHYTVPVIQPNCVAWQAENDTSMQPRRIGKVGPFYTDGTCDGSGAGRCATTPRRSSRVRLTRRGVQGDTARCVSP